MIKFFLAITSLEFICESFSEGYNRLDFSYRSYKPDTSIGFYTGKTCDFINIDHIVSLKHAYESGASSWGASEKEIFAAVGDSSNRRYPTNRQLNLHQQTE